jgi:hypothetical protein
MQKSKANFVIGRGGLLGCEILRILLWGARGSLVVKAPGYKPKGRGFKTR